MNFYAGWQGNTGEKPFAYIALAGDPHCRTWVAPTLRTLCGEIHKEARADAILGVVKVGYIFASNLTGAGIIHPDVYSYYRDPDKRVPYPRQWKRLIEVPEEFLSPASNYHVGAFEEAINLRDFLNASQRVEETAVAFAKCAREFSDQPTCCSEHYQAFVEAEANLAKVLGASNE